MLESQFIKTRGIYIINVEIVEYNPDCNNAFEKEKKSLIDFSALMLQPLNTLEVHPFQINRQYNSYVLMKTFC
jgi:hypothetical protein